MRFVRLELRAFGSFANAPPIEFEGARGLHMVLGPNEAGKSTALRAIRRLLYGFPHQAGDDHRHKYEDLRIGATLRDEAGRELSFLRRKKKRVEDSVWTLDDSGMIDPATLTPFLSGVDQDRFADLFSMDHAELIKGGRAILGGGGRIGELLFAAGSGLAGIDEVRKKLDAEAEALFKPTGRVPVINTALTELAAARAEAKTSMLATSDWVALDTQISRARLQHAEIEAERRQVEAVKKRREAIARALPILRQRDEVAAQLERSRGVPVLADGFTELRRKASGSREMSARIAADAGTSLEAITLELANLGPPDPVLGEAEAIARIQGSLGLYQKTRRNRPTQRRELAAAEAEAAALLAEFLPDRTIGQLAEARALGSRRGQVQELALQTGLLEAACARAERDVEAAASSLIGLADAPPVADSERLAETLAEVIGRLADAGKPDDRLADARAERMEAERQAEVDLRALRLWSGSLEDLEALALPSLKTIDRFKTEFAAADDAIARAESERIGLTNDRLALEREIEAVRLAGPVPTEAELEARRAERDQTWRLVRARWLGEVGSAPPSESLAARFEDETRTADHMADRLRREADRVAEQSRREADRQALASRFDALGETLTRASADRARVLENWRSLWQPLGLDPLPPEEMRDWIQIDRKPLVTKSETLRKLRIKEDRARETIAGFRSELGQGLAGLGEPPDDPAESLAALLARARRAVKQVANTREFAEARSRQSKALATRDAWKARWLAAVEPLGLDQDASAARATAVLDGIDRAARALENAAALVEAGAEADRVGRDWEAEVLAVLDRLQTEPPAETEPESLALLLVARLDAAREAKTRREGLLGAEAREHARLEEAKAEATRADVTLEGLAREARCASIAELDEAERASEAVKEARKRLQGLDERLTDLAGPIPFEAFLEEARAADFEAIGAEIATLADRLGPLDQLRAQLSEEIGGCEERLKRMDGGPAAAEAQQAVEARLARLAVDVERYAQLRLASAVLREAVERHRKEHQGPILARAGNLFVDLTLGSFAGLRAEVDDKGHPVLLGLRGDGVTPLGVEGMSEGTADQLYLALRLASLQAHLDDHEPMPLVLDDLLINFDDARALAALNALANLSSRTQILFFTHHAHLVELARSGLPGDNVFVHHLAYPPVEVPADAPPEPKPAGAARSNRKKKATIAAEESEFLR